MVVKLGSLVPLFGRMTSGRQWATAVTVAAATANRAGDLRAATEIVLAMLGTVR